MGMLVYLLYIFIIELCKLLNNEVGGKVANSKIVRVTCVSGRKSIAVRGNQDYPP